MNRRFRIVSLQLEDIGECYDEEEVNVALQSIPGDIEDAYFRKLKGVLPRHVRRLSHIFYWISLAMRQLTTIELIAAPGVDLPSPDELHNICPRGMIRTELQRSANMDRSDSELYEVQNSSDTEREIVTFDHPSVKRYLYSNKLQNSGDDYMAAFFISEHIVNAKLTSLMLDHLLAVKQPVIESSIFVERPFLQYEAQHWHDHLPDRKNITSGMERLKQSCWSYFGIQWIQLISI